MDTYRRNTANHSREDFQRKKAEREKYYADFERNLNRIKQDSGYFHLYLGVQGNLPNYSIGNCLMIADQFPVAREVHKLSTWQGMGVSPMPGNPGMTILIPGDKFKGKDGRWIQGYETCQAYDVMQTSAAAQYQEKELPSDKELLRGLLEYQRGAWTFETVDRGDRAIYDVKRNVITIRRGQRFEPLFAAVSAAVAQADGFMRDPQADPHRITQISGAIAYMLCHRYRISTDILTTDVGIKNINANIIMGSPTDWRRNLQADLVVPMRSMVESLERNLIREATKESEAVFE